MALSPLACRLLLATTSSQLLFFRTARGSGVKNKKKRSKTPYFFSNDFSVEIYVETIYAPRYAIRTSQRVRTHSYIHTYATGEPGTSTYHIFSYIYSAWNELVPACNSSAGWNLSLAIREHITTKLHEHRYAIRTSQRVRTHSYIHKYATGEPGTSTYHIFSYIHIVRGTSWYQPVIPVPAGTSPGQLEDISPPSSTNSDRLWTRAEVNGGANKGPPQTHSGPKSMVFRRHARDKAQCMHTQTGEE